MRIILWIGGILLLGWPGRGWADPAWVDTLSTDAHRTVKVTEKLVTAPFCAKAEGWMYAGAIAGVAIFSAAFDEDVQNAARNWDQPWIRKAENIGHGFQQTGAFFGVPVLFYGVGIAANQPKLRRVGQDLVVAFVVASSGTQLMKHLAGRARPDENKGPWEFRGPTLDDQYHSFWSGDVTTAFTLASVLAAEAKHPAVTVVLYSLATTTALQRVREDRHWFSDVVGAAAWSTAVGIGTVKISEHVHVTPAGFTAMW